MDYYFDKTKDKYRSDCKDCNKKYKKIYHQRVEVKETHANRERERRKRDDVKEYQRNYNVKQWQKYKFDHEYRNKKNKSN